jgi:hypothetical protein
MNLFLHLFVFFVVLFLYIHIYYHLKTSDDLEMYEIEQPSKEKLEEICDLKQPVVFNFMNERFMETCCIDHILNIYGAFEVQVRDTKIDFNDDEEIYTTLPFHHALQLLKDDKEQRYYIEKNMDFLEETGLLKVFKYNDAFVRPYLVMNCVYDYIIGSQDTKTPFCYDVSYRNYYMVTEGNVKLKLAPPKSLKYLYPVNDYENFEFRARVNPWDTQPEYKSDFDKVHCLELDLKKGQMVYIPPYWWYSFHFVDNHTSICRFEYKTYMSMVAILPKLLMRILQTLNIKHAYVKKHNKINILYKHDANTINSNINVTMQNQENKLNESNEMLKMNETQPVPTSLNTTSLDALNNLDVSLHLPSLL